MATEKPKRKKNQRNPNLIRFSHFRNRDGNLLGTVAHKEISSGKTAYGVTLVSCTEPESRVTAAIGRLKAKYRCEAACNGKQAEWREYAPNKKDKDYYESNISCNPVYGVLTFSATFLYKLGTMPTDQFVKRLKKIRKSI